MNEEKFYELAARVLSDEASSDDRDELNNYLKDENFQEKFSLIRKNWNGDNLSVEKTSFRNEDGWQKLTGKIRKYEPGNETEPEGLPVWTMFLKSRYALVMASVIIVVLAGYWLLSLTGVVSNEETITWNSKSTVSGQISIITLFDGSRITLNSESRLKYPGKFGTASREIFLEGEAYFEVKSDPSRPFIVHSDNVSTEVLGTKFNVKAYREESEIKISLVEGQVKVNNQFSNLNKEPVYLKPNEQLSFNKSNGIVTLDKFALLQTIGWKDNILVFDNEPLEKVLVALRRSFGVQFELEDTTFNRLKIKANFENESFWTIIKVIRNATNLEYRTVSKNDELQKIIFYHK